jgi:integrase
MPRLSISTPKYSFHKASKQAVVYLNSACHYLGPWKSVASLDEYNRLVALWLANGRQLPVDPAQAPELTINEVLLKYLAFADSYYVKHGRPTSEAADIRLACGPLVDLYGRTAINTFGPLALKIVREKMIQADWCRNYVNKNVGRIKRFFKWATENELVRGDVFHALSALAGLRKGRSAARETDPVKPVPDEHIDAVLSRVPKPVAAMIRLQRITGMRPGSVVIMRGCDIVFSEGAWQYRPSTHKTEHHDLDLIVFLGPQSQEIIKPFFKGSSTLNLFSPEEAEAERNAEKRRSRKTPMTPSHAQRALTQGRQRPPGNRYTVDSYRRAIERACKKADISVWTPNRLRHNAGTRLRREFGLEAAQVVLGHQSAAVTELYAERDHARAAEIMARVG